jgi:hypothetical protein
VQSVVLLEAHFSAAFSAARRVLTQLQAAR